MEVTEIDGNLDITGSSFAARIRLTVQWYVQRVLLRVVESSFSVGAVTICGVHPVLGQHLCSTRTHLGKLSLGRVEYLIFFLG